MAVVVLGAGCCCCCSAASLQYSFPRTRTPLERSLNGVWRATNVLTQRLLGAHTYDPSSVKALRVRKVGCAAPHS